MAAIHLVHIPILHPVKESAGPFICTSPESPHAFRGPAPWPPLSESADLYPFQDNTWPSYATPAGFPPVPARRERSGIGLVSPDEWNIRHPAGSCIANRDRKSV